MNYFLKSINLLNILLAAAVVVTAQYMVLPRVNKEVKYSPPVVRVVPPSKGNEKQKKEAASAAAAAPVTDYTLIADQNLFHPERKIPVEKPVVQPLPRPELELYGTLITGNASLAYVNDKKAPLSTPGRGARLRVLKKGDVINGFVLTSIEADKIVLARGDDVMVVNLQYNNRPKEAEQAAPGTPGFAPGQTPAVPGTIPGAIQPRRSRR